MARSAVERIAQRGERAPPSAARRPPACGAQATAPTQGADTARGGRRRQRDGRNTVGPRTPARSSRARRRAARDSPSGVRRSDTDPQASARHRRAYRNSVGGWTARWGRAHPTCRMLVQPRESARGFLDDKAPAASPPIAAMGALEAPGDLENWQQAASTSPALDMRRIGAIGLSFETKGPRGPFARHVSRSSSKGATWPLCAPCVSIFKQRGHVAPFAQN